MIVGFTGTKKGMTYLQKTEVRSLLIRIKPDKTVHGDCVGADAEFHKICQELGISVILRPSNNNRYRAYCQGAEMTFSPQEPLNRNKAIVGTTQLLIATPAGNRDVLRSGTWFTIRYAQKIGRPVILIMAKGDTK